MKSVSLQNSCYRTTADCRSFYTYKNVANGRDMMTVTQKDEIDHCDTKRSEE
jgi:hypothetical protein